MRRAWMLLFNGEGVLFRWNPGTGVRTLLSDFGCSDGCLPTNQGTRGRDPTGVAPEAAGTILVIDFAAGTGTFGSTVPGGIREPASAPY